MLNRFRLFAEVLTVEGSRVLWSKTTTVPFLHDCQLLAPLLMAYNPKFGPAAQTPEARAWVLRQMQATIPSLKKSLAPCAQLFYQRYIAGELSWAEMRQALAGTGAASGSHNPSSF